MILDTGNVGDEIEECGAGLSIGLAVGRSGQVVGQLKDAQANTATKSEAKPLHKPSV